MSRGRKVPGYKGFVPGIVAENLYGNTFGRASRQAKQKEYYPGIDVPPQKRYQSTYKWQHENFNDPEVTDRIPTTDRGDILIPPLTVKPKHNRGRTIVNKSSEIGFDSQINSRDSGNQPCCRSLDRNLRALTENDKVVSRAICDDDFSPDRRVIISKYNMRQKTVADTSAQKENAHKSRDFSHERTNFTDSYKCHKMDLNSIGTDRVAIMTELKNKGNLWKNNPNLIHNFSKIKKMNEFKKEFPIVSVAKGDYVKHGTVDYNFHSFATKGGYKRHACGMPYNYS